MIRVSTASSYANMLANLTLAQARQDKAGTQVSSEKNAADLKGYAKQAEVLTAMRGVQTKVAGFLEQTSQLSGKLELQDAALTRVGDSATGARTAIANALAADDGTTIKQALSGFFNDAAGALNSTYDGRYIFAGGQTDTQPVATTSMAQLAAPATVAAQFQNDSRITTNRLDENTTMPTGFLASDLGDKFFTAMKAVQDYIDTNGDFSTPLSAAQKTFLTTQMGVFDGSVTDLTNATASNGLMQNRLESTRADLNARSDALDGMVGDITNVDMPAAISKLQQAQLSVQAAAQVFQSLSGSSLLALLQN
jgi:flagellar hook-associated protein 3 FlgL